MKKTLIIWVKYIGLHYFKLLAPLFTSSGSEVGPSLRKFNTVAWMTMQGKTKTVGVTSIESYFLFLVSVKLKLCYFL